ncbi:MAG: F0F1 ATP synthase subunit delta [Tidjanibacter sp.]|nr:F0F1 ATP synthase subunit delta [Tidjanibacter sp.]
MNFGLLSRRYARALLSYATSLGQADELYPLMKEFAHSVMATPELREAIGSPVVGREAKRQLIVEAFGGDNVLSLNRFVDIVLENGRADWLPEMAIGYVTLYRASRGIKVVRLTSATPLPPDRVERIRDDVAARGHCRVEISALTDPSLGGGFVFQVDDLRLDASLKTQIERIRRGFESFDKSTV